MLEHFIDLSDFSQSKLKSCINEAQKLKEQATREEYDTPLKDKILAVIFAKQSTRTRLSFEVGMTQLGGKSIFLTQEAIHLGTNESIMDTAKTISLLVNAVAIRTFDHNVLRVFAEHLEIPLVNALSNQSHPTQTLADIMTYIELRGKIEGKRVAWIGDGNNICKTYIQAAQCFNFELYIASPKGYAPDVIGKKTHLIHCLDDPREAVSKSDLVVTDVWSSMGDEIQTEQRMRDFQNYQVNKKLMTLASPEALFTHCLPAKKGLEVTEDVLYGNKSIAWKVVTNKLHIIKAILKKLIIDRRI